MDSSATETDDENPPDNPVPIGRRKKKRESDDSLSVAAKKRLKRHHKEDSPKKKTQLKTQTQTIYSDTKVTCRRVMQSCVWDPINWLLCIDYKRNSAWILHI